MDTVLLPQINVFFYIVSFFMGLVLGSFANVCIYRIPLDLSVVKPRSSCPNCKKMIAWYDNIPVLSYIFLGGKCRHCKIKISSIYPVVELITGLSFLILFHFHGLHIDTILFCFTAFCFVAISGIDYKYQIIPDIFPVMLLIVGLLFAVFNTTIGQTYLQRILNAVLGVFAGGGFLFLIGILGRFLFKKEAMGGGDVKLMAGVGAIIGWERVLLAIFLASFLGSIFGLFLIISKKVERRGYMPFGPFLAAGSYLTLLMPAPSILLNAFFSFEFDIINKFFGA